jgi:hypothetical protein
VRTLIADQHWIHEARGLSGGLQRIHIESNGEEFIPSRIYKVSARQVAAGLASPDDRDTFAGVQPLRGDVLFV